jgi:hypothetical protein
MLSRSELLALDRSLRTERVLSVYIDGTATDVAAKQKWRLDLAHSLRDLRRWLDGSSREDQRALEQCIGLLEHELGAFSGTVGAPGWVAFITTNGVQRAERVPAPAPTLAVWSTGPSIAPYMRILKQMRPVIVAVVDARKGRVYRYQAGELSGVETVRAHTAVEAPSHMGDAPRGGFHPGVRGPTGHDAAQRSRLAGTRRFVGELADETTRLAGPDGWILVGGIPEAAAQTATALGQLAPGRVRVLESLDVHATDAEVAAAARAGASALRDDADLEQIVEIVDGSAGEGLATLGSAATGEALNERRVRELYLTRRYRDSHAAEAETAVRAALAQGAAVEEVSRGAAARLDEHGGIGARLRYRLATPAPS